MKFLNKIKKFEDLKPIVIKRDKWFNPDGVKKITKELINEMLSNIETKYKPNNLSELKENIYDHITTKKGKIFIDNSNFNR